MKKFLLLLSVTMFAVGCSTTAQQVKYNITGDTPSVEGKLYLYVDGNVIDSTDVAEGKFTLQGEVAEPIMARIGKSEKRSRGDVSLFLEEGEISVSEADDKLVASGTPANDRYNAYRKSVSDLANEWRAEGTTDERKAEIQEAISKASEDLLNDNRDNVLGAYMLISDKIYNLDAAGIDEELAKFPEFMQTHPYLVKAKEMADVMRKSAVGQPYMNVTLPSPDGTELSLSSYVGEGKYVLLDFWASWCGPCMREIPHIKEAYNTYHDKGFEIFGVSLDDNKEAWTKCIETRELNWIHVSALKGWDCPAAKEYGVRGIPASYLIGPDGTIVASGDDLRGEKLAAKLAELIGE
jgi:peroxiredoxin